MLVCQLDVGEEQLRLVTTESSSSDKTATFDLGSSPIEKRR
jgi:hypothetical protein